MESLSLVAMMASEAPRTSAPSKAAGSATGSSYSNMVASLAAAMKKFPMEKLASAMAFCEAPFDGTLDGTTSAPSAGGSSASANNVPEAGGEDEAALRRAWQDGFKKRPLREKAGTAVDGLAIFETVALNVN